GVKVGLVVSPTRLVRLIGESGAKDLILTGRKIFAKEAYEMGLIHDVVPPEELMHESYKVAKMIASRAPIAVKRAKKAIQKVLDLSYTDSIDYEIKQFIACQKTNDHKLAIDAFFNKEKPFFKGE